MMSIEIQLPAGEDPLLISSIFVEPRQRQLLAVLQEGPTPLTRRDLAVHLAAQEGDKSPSEVSDTERQELQVELHHRYLPKLEQAGLIERHPNGIVATGQLSLEGTEWTFPHIDDPDVPSWEALAALLARPRRQHIVAVLAGHRDPLALEDLAAELAHDRSSGKTDGGEIEPDLRAMLHHIDLPALDEAGLIDYDSDKRTVIGEPALSTLGGEMDNGTTGTTDIES